MTVYLLDLTGAQIDRIEDALALPMDRWGGAHKGKLYPAILHVALGGELAEYEALPMRELVAMVDVEDAPGKDESA